MIAALLRVILGSLVLPAVVSVLVFGYLGYRGVPYWIVTPTAVFLTCYQLWTARPSFRHVFGANYPLSPWWHKPTQIAAIALIFFGAFWGIGSGIYFWARSFSN